MQRLRTLRSRGALRRLGQQHVVVLGKSPHADEGDVDVLVQAGRAEDPLEHIHDVRQVRPVVERDLVGPVTAGEVQHDCAHGDRSAVVLVERELLQHHARQVPELP